ncbi:MAG: hypothetical protein JJE04_17905, partial [Acidobacteriia bacterium]|nr:hypothetical protein [Terriglobia bacterium]
MQTIRRRALLATPMALGALAQRKAMEEDDPANLKIGHILNWNVSDSFLLFCKQIGLKW